MDRVGPTAQCHQCLRTLHLDEHGQMPAHWNFESFGTDECPGADAFNRGRQEMLEARHRPQEPPAWAVRMELRILERLDGVLAERAAMERVVIATRRAQEALRKLDR